MHIIFKTKEKPILEKVKLPLHTTLVEESARGKPLKRWVITKKGWHLQEDFIEQEREFTKKEREDFEQSLTRDRVVDFFVHYKEDIGHTVPEREHSAYCSAEYRFCKNIQHDGTYIRNGPKRERRNIFQIRVSKTDNLDDAEKEVADVLDRIAKANPTWNPIYINLLEDTLSEYGSYSIYWNRKKTFSLHKTTYGCQKTVARFTSLRKLLKYIQLNHFYGDEE